MFYPVLCILASAVRDNEGGFAPEQFLAKLLSPSIWSLACLTGARGCGVAWNTVAVAALVGVLTTLLGLAFALVALRTRMPMKPLLRALSILPIITPPFVIGLALILLFGRAGMSPCGSATCSTSRAAAGSTACPASPSRRSLPSRRLP